MIALASGLSYFDLHFLGAGAQLVARELGFTEPFLQGRKSCHRDSLQ